MPLLRHVIRCLSATVVGASYGCRETPYNVPLVALQTEFSRFRRSGEFLLGEARGKEASGGDDPRADVSGK